MSDTKRCCVCMRRLPRAEFIKNPHCHDGLSPYCRGCRRRLISMNLRLIKKPPPRDAEERKTRDYLYKRSARDAVTFCVKMRWMFKPKSCQRCPSALGLEAHHHDYSKPLEVEWLCRQCHITEHRTWTES